MEVTLNEFLRICLQYLSLLSHVTIQMIILISLMVDWLLWLNMLLYMCKTMHARRNSTEMGIIRQSGTTLVETQSKYPGFTIHGTRLYRCLLKIGEMISINWIHGFKTWELPLPECVGNYIQFWSHMNITLLYSRSQHFTCLSSPALNK